MARRFTRGRGRTGSVRRESFWVPINAISQALTATQSVLTNSASAGLLAIRPFTIVRTHITWLLQSDQVAASENYAAAVAGCVVSDQASAIGVTAVPTPITDQGSDFFWFWDSAIGNFEFHSDIGTMEAGRMQKIDSKAMRKVDEDSDLIFVIENEPTIGTDGCSIKMLGRMLIKLH